MRMARAGHCTLARPWAPAHPSIRLLLILLPEGHSCGAPSATPIECGHQTCVASLLLFVSEGHYY